jgi:hypothetical protein
MSFHETICDHWWRAKVAAAFAAGREAEAADRAERAAAAPKVTAEQRAADEIAEQAAEEEWWRQRCDFEDIGSDE